MLSFEEADRSPNMGDPGAASTARGLADRERVDMQHGNRSLEQLSESAAVWEELQSLYRRWRVAAGDDRVEWRFGQVAQLAATEVESG